MPVPIYGDQPTSATKPKKPAEDDCEDVKILDTYIKRTTNVLTQLNGRKDKNTASQRLKLMSADIQRRIDRMIASGEVKHTAALSSP
jgi:hypothetical protein